MEGPKTKMVLTDNAEKESDFDCIDCDFYSFSEEQASIHQNNTGHEIWVKVK